MSVLPYCMVEADQNVAPPPAGFRGLPVLRRGEAGVACYYSLLEKVPEKLTKDDAVAFYAVVRDIFAHTGVLPFRFPTLLQDENELEEYLITNGGEHLDTLQRLRDRVQMEVRLTYAGARAAGAESGRKYLETRQDARQALQNTAAAARHAAGQLALGWREHDFSSGLRCYALASRQDVDAFRKVLHSLHPEHDVKAVVSGPWPPTEFIHEPDVTE